MNNSALRIEEHQSPTEAEVRQHLETREGELVRMIEALGSLSQTREWSTLKDLIFDGVVEGIERRLKSEALTVPLRLELIYHLQGQLTWARRYSNLEELSDMYKAELINIRKQLNPPTERVHGS